MVKTDQRDIAYMNDKVLYHSLSIRPGHIRKIILCRIAPVRAAIREISGACRICVVSLTSRNPRHPAGH